MYEDLGNDFGGLHWLVATRGTAETAARVGFDLRRRGEAVPATDLMIAGVALENDCQLWHLDSHFDRIARITRLKQRTVS